MHLGWKGPSISSSPTVNLTYQVTSLNHTPYDDLDVFEATSLKNQCICTTQW